MTIYSLGIVFFLFGTSKGSMYSSKCCFLTCIWVSQESGQVVWYSHLFQNFPQFIVLHTLKGFHIANKADIDVFYGTLVLFQWSSRCCQFDLWFLCLFWSSRFTYCWSLAWRILSITLLACEMSAIVWWFELSLALPFFGIGMKTDLFQSFGHCWIFQIC